MFEKLNELDTFVEMIYDFTRLVVGFSFLSFPSFIVVLVFTLIFYFKIQRKLSKLEPKVNKLVSFLEKK